MAGLIASDVLSRFGAATLQYWNSRLVLGLPGIPRTGASVPASRLPRSGFIESVHVTINHAHVPFALDTGAAFSVVDPQIAAQSKLRTIGRSGRIGGATGCQVPETPVALNAWELGSIKLPTALVLKINSTQSLGRLHVDGILGSDVLSAFKNVTLNYLQHRVQLSGAMHRQPPTTPRRRGSREP
ncbi:MAG TPA: retropepsin-like aspartic protease [Solirubrobacteraceae bacterium]|nr:retropepsin-like aspartic protease [Solirubrobacteraceae bacterium]